MDNRHTVRLLLSQEHECGYLPDLNARSAFIDPAFPLSAKHYGAFLAQGFRRSGGYVYRPLCRDCHACRPARVPVKEFQPDRIQRRTLRANANLEFHIAPSLDHEHFLLYQRYLESRHPNGGMDSQDANAFYDFVDAHWSNTNFWEFREAGRLMIFSVVDHVPNGLSAVYTCFEPDAKRRSLGTFAILRQIEEARAAALDYLYLGYWVDGSRTMDYKRRFKPLEILAASGWKIRDKALTATMNKSIR